MSETYWRLSKAIAWIAGRRDEAVAEAPSAIVLLLLVDMKGSGVPEAKTALWAALQVGMVTATGIGPDGERCPIPKERWQDLQPYLKDETEKLQRPAFHPGTSFTDVTVSSADVRKLWPAGSTAVHAPEPKNYPEQVAAIISRNWPKGKPEGMKVKDYENAIVAQVKAETGSTISTRTVARAIKLAK
jgi:hypothetical protein